jgi:hypothetical protein
MGSQLQGASDVVDPVAAASGASGAYAASQSNVYQSESMKGRKSDNQLSAIAQGF